MLRRALGALALALALSFVPGSAEAQYFGRNRVQYEDFDFKVLQTTHFDIYYYPEEREAVETAARMAERWYARLSTILGHELSTRQPLIIYAAHPHFRQTNVLPSEPGVGTGGVTELLKRRIVLPLAGALSETDHVIGHELVHAFQFDITTGQGGAAAGGVPGALLLPLWFVEGMAEYLSVGPVDPHTTMWIRGAILGENLPGLGDLPNPANSPYRFGQALWAYIAGRWGDKVVGDMLRIGGANGVDAAIREVLKVEPEELIEGWHQASREAFEAVSRNTDPPSAVARRILAEETSRGDLNIAPSISPDGSRVVFLSTRELFSLDLYVANVETGRVERKLVDTVGDQHFDNLQFIESSGSWSPDGRRFVFAAVKAGQPVLSIFDVDRGRAEREVVFRDLGEVFNPAWSPDGNRIAFTGVANGLLDLYVHDLSRANTTRLTNDAYAELQPCWSPDGERLAFATDRFSTDLELLQFANFHLATIRVSDGSVERLPGFSNAKHLNPEWTEASSIFFLADPSGVTNIYRLDLPTGRLAQLTDVVTGVSGITALSPSLSAARTAPRVVFSAYGRENVLNVYQIDTEEALRGREAGSPALLEAAAILPPPALENRQVVALLGEPTLNLPPESAAFDTKDYEAELSLDYIGQPTVQVGTDSLGAFVGGGIGFFWSDLLGNHQLGAAVQVSGSVRDIGGQIGYQNLDNRWNWGVVAQRLPYRSGGVSRTVTTVDGTLAVVDQVLISRETHTDFNAMAAYPFSRAQRIEVFGGLKTIGFSRTLDIEAFSIATGATLIDEQRDLPSLDRLNLGRAGAALVYDTALFGLTSPIRGGRYRLEFAQSAGSLTYSTAMADLRRYFMPVSPVTIAMRGLHYGRYGASADDTRLFPLFLGYPNLVRGYDVESFRASECPVGTDGACPVFDNLLGSRLLVANLELRAPVWGLFGGEQFYGPLPLEIALFTDAGVAWTGDESPSFAGGSRDFVKSVGVALRANLFNYLIAEIDFVRPLDRPGRGWTWQFNFTPGF